MPHPLGVQLRFARSELQRALEGVTDAEARRRFMPMNCISWNIGHLAWQEQRYWLLRAQGQVLMSTVNDLFAYGAPASTPPLDEVLDAWHTLTRASDPWLDAATTATLQEPVIVNGKPLGTNFGNLLLRLIYHYWYHTGE